MVAFNGRVPARPRKQVKEALTDFVGIGVSRQITFNINELGCAVPGFDIERQTQRIELPAGSVAANEGDHSMF